MSGSKSVKETKDVVVFGAKTANGIQAALKDKTISLSDASILFGLLGPLKDAIEGMSEIPAELGDFQPEEAVELIAAVGAELVVDDEKAKKIINAALDLLATSTPKVAALVEACKS